MINTTITGNIGKSEMRYTQTGKPLLNVSIASQAKRFDKDINDWVDDSETTWLNVTFWEKDAEKYEQLLVKGVRVSVSGSLVTEAYETDQGAFTKLVLRKPRLLGIIPSTKTGQNGAENSAGSQGYGNAMNVPNNGNSVNSSAGSAYDPWGGQPQQASFDDASPF